MSDQLVAGSERETRVLALLVFDRMVAFAYNGVLGPLLSAVSATYHIALSDAAWLAAATAVGWTLSATRAPSLIARWGAKRTMLIGLGIMALSLVATPWMPSLTAILIDRLVGGFGGGFMGPSSNVYIIETFASERRPRAFGWIATGFALGGAVLVPLLVFGSQWWRWQGSFVAEGLTIGVAIALSALILPRSRKTSGPDLSMVRPEKSRFVDSPLSFLAANFVERSGNAVMLTFWPALLVARYHWSLSQVAPITGIMYLSGALGSVLGGSLLTRWRWREKPLYIGGVGIAGLLLGLTFAWTGLPILGYVVGGCAYALCDNAARPAYFQLVSRARRTYQATMGLNAISNQLGGVAGNFALPLLVAASGYATLGWFGVFISGASVVLVTRGRLEY